MDCFALLDERRRPWLEPETLKQKFLSRSAAVHPDHVHAAGESERQTAQQQFTELNGAYQRLRDTKERLQHLLELETGAPPAQVQRVPAALMELAMRVGQLCREADAFLEEKAKVVSPLLQVALFERSQEWIEKLKGIGAQLETQREQLLSELRELDARWVSGSEAEGSGREALLASLENLYRRFSYYNRWSGQIQERVTRLSF